MALPKNWNTHSVLSLLLDYGLNSIDAFSAVNSFNSIDDFVYISRIGTSNSLFESKPELGEAERQMELCQKHGYSIVSVWDEKYPELLKDIQYPPAVIYVKGELNNSDALSISIVGTRHTTIYGKIVAERFAEYFSRHNLIVTSGLAYGIDSYAHQSVVKAEGVSYAVVASGLDCLSPGWAIKLADSIVDKGGAIITEYRCGTKAKPGYFPQRNRIISGISKGTLVVESDEKGGSMITARFALDQSRELFAVPGNITSQKSKGTNILITKYSAIPALSPEYILECLGFNQLNPEPAAKIQNNLTPAEQKVISALKEEPIQIDELIGTSNLEIPELLSTLLSLEFKDLVKQLPGKHYILLK